MAFVRVFDALSATVHRDALSAPAAEVAAPAFRQSIQEYPWAVPDRGAVLLNAYGISASGYGFQSHPHPIHKIYETHLLFTKWKCLADKPSTILYMKDSKFNKLKSLNSNFVDLCNRFNVPKDRERYAKESPGPIETPYAFMHDSLMYYHPSEILGMFDQSPKLQRLHASLVIPAESSFGLKSLQPMLYNFTKRDGRLHYYLEGRTDGGYDQPESADIWLKIHEIVSPTIKLSVTLVSTHGPFHTVLITRDAGQPTVNRFDTPASCLLPNPIDTVLPLYARLVPKDVYDALFTYVRAVRTLRVTDPAGHIRTQRGKPENDWVDACAWDNLANFALLTASFRPKHRFPLFSGVWARVHAFVSNYSDYFLATGTALLTRVGYAAIFWSHTRSLAHLRIRGNNIFTDLWPWQRFWRDLPRIVTGQNPYRISFYQPVRIHEKYGHHVPAIIWRRFPSLRPSRMWHQKAAYLLAAAGGLAALYFLTRRYSLQKQSDRYLEYMHQPRFYLEFTTTSYRTHVKPFFDILKSDASSGKPHPHDNSDSGLGASVAPSKPATTLSRRSAHFLETGVDPGALRRATEFIRDPGTAFFKPKTPTPAPRPSLAPSRVPAESDDESEASDTISIHTPDPDEDIEVHEIDGAFVKLPKARPVPAPRRATTVPVRKSEPELDSDSISQPRSLPPPEKLTSAHGAFVPSMNERIENDQTLLRNDSTAYGPPIEAKNLFSMASGEGNWLTRRRAPAAPIPPLPDMNICLLQAISEQSGHSTSQLWQTLASNLPDTLVTNAYCLQYGFDMTHLELLCAIYRVRARVITSGFHAWIGAESQDIWHLRYVPGHWMAVPADTENPPVPQHEQDSFNLLSFLNDNPLIPTRTVFPYQQTIARAKNLMANMKNGYDGMFATMLKEGNRDPHLLQKWDSLIDTAAPRTVQISLVQGFAGCGKSWPVAKALRRRHDYLVLVPTTRLREEWKEQLRLRSIEGWRVSTWESGMTKTASLVVIDEVYKMPNGYLDALITVMPATTAFLLLGCPIQGDYHSTRPDSTNSRLIPESEHLRPYFDIYCHWTHRLDQTTAGLLGVYTTSQMKGSISRGPTMHRGQTVLASSINAADTLNHNGYIGMTASNSQGLTLNRKSAVYLDKNWLKASNQVSLVAATRSKVGLHFSGDLNVIRQHSGLHPAFDALLNQKPIRYLETQSEILGNRVRILNHPDELLQLGPAVLAIPNFTGGSLPRSIGPMARSIIRPARYQQQSLNRRFARMHSRASEFVNPPLPRNARPRKPDDEFDVIADFRNPSTQPNVIPSLCTNHLPETRRPLHYDINCAVSEPVEITEAPEPQAPYEPVYPGYNYEMFYTELTRPEDPTDLEILFRGDSSNQFPHLDVPFEGGAATLQLIAPTHNSKKDPTLLPASITKRLKFRPSNSPISPSAEDQMAALLLYESYCDALLIDSNEILPFDDALYIDCIAENEFAQLSSKTKAVIAANANRSDPDWRHTVVRIFSKTQQKINEGSLFGPWKACQTLALMHDAIVLIFGPVKKYQRAIIARHGSNPKIFVYAGHSPFDLSSFCRKNFPPATRRCWNDFESYDVTQGAETTLFEQKKMQRLSIPEPISDLHVFIKMNLLCQFGPLKPIRHTGEPGTYDDNTDYDIAVTNLKFDIRTDGGLFSGDDSALPRIPLVRDTWAHNQKYFPNLKFKTEVGEYATFCGYYVGSAGAVRCPKPLLTKLMISKDRGDLPDKIPSYLAEFAVGHSLGDEMWDMLPADQVPYQSAAYDFFCRHASRDLKVALNIGEVPEDVISSWGCKMTRAIFATLNRASRIRYLKAYPSRFASWASSFMPKSR